MHFLIFFSFYVFNIYSSSYFGSKKEVVSKKLHPIKVENFLMSILALNQTCKIVLTEKCQISTTSLTSIEGFGKTLSCQRCTDLEFSKRMGQVMS